MSQMLHPTWWFEGFRAGFWWWLACVAMAAAALPLALRMFRGLGDRGAGVAAPFGMGLVLLTTWVLALDRLGSGTPAASVRGIMLGLCAACTVRAWWMIREWERRPLPEMAAAQWFAFGYPVLFFGFLGTVHLPHRAAAVWVAVGLVAMWSAVAWMGEGRRLLRTLRTIAVPLVAAQSLFLAGFVFFLMVRSYIPYATFETAMSGAEKFGNLMHLNSAMRASTLPPADAWFMGLPTNYYYGGHLLVATIAKSIGMEARFAFNLGIATIFGLTLSTGFSFVYNLIAAPGKRARLGRIVWHRGMGWALFGALAIACFGNLDALQQLALRDPALVRGAVQQRLENELRPRFSDDEQLAQAVARRLARPGSLRFSPENLARIDFWRSSRAIHGGPDDLREPGTITEFPYFSAILGDLHPHHMALPFGMLVLSAVLSLMRSAARFAGTGTQWMRRIGPRLALVGLTVGLVFTINIWDAVVAGPLVLLAVCASLRGVRCEPRWDIAAFAGAFLCGAAVFSLILNAIPGSVPVFGKPVLFVAAVTGMIAFAWWIRPQDEWRFFLPQERLHAAGMIAGLLVIAAAGGWMAGEGRGATMRVSLAVRDGLLFMALGAAAFLWAYCFPSAWKRRAGLYVLALVILGGAALVALLPFKLYFSPPLVTEGPLLASILPLVPDEGIAVADGFWRVLWTRSVLSPLPPELSTSLGDYFVHWGVFLVPIIILLLVRLVQVVRGWPAGGTFALVGVLAALLALLANALQSWTGPVAMILAAGCITVLLSRRTSLEQPIWCFLAAAFYFHWLVEALYFDDEYTGLLERYNTLFKLYYPLWPIMAGGMVVALHAASRALAASWREQRRDEKELALSPAVYPFLLTYFFVLPWLLRLAGMERMRMLWLAAGILVLLLTVSLMLLRILHPSILSGARPMQWINELSWRSPVLFAAGLLLIVGMLYPYSATATRTRSFFTDHSAIPPWASKPTDREYPIYAVQSLDAIRFLRHKETYADDAHAIDWLLRNAPRGARILEAPPIRGLDAADLAGASYSPAGRFAATTGLPTLVGWVHHEMNWRGWTKSAPPDLALHMAPYLTVDDLHLRVVGQEFFPEGMLPAEVRLLKHLALSGLAADPRELRAAFPAFNDREIALLHQRLNHPLVGRIMMLDLAGRLIDQADLIYRSSTLTPHVAELIRFHDLEYIAAGSLERIRYAPSGGLRKFEQWEVAFRHGETTIYRVPPELRPPEAGRR